MAAAPSIFPLALTGVGFRAKGLNLLRGITCTLEAGPRTVILGPNGAGKSLLLRLCHGLIPASSGEIAWRGTGGNAPARSQATRAPARAQATRAPARTQAMVFQRPIMLRRSVAANVGYALSLAGVPRRERAALVDEVLAKTGLRPLADRSARVLSFGEQQKLALARAWVLQPQVLFLDEPTASLDPSATHAFEEIIADIRASGCKIIMTTHDLGQARRIADEVLFLNRGRLLEHAPADAFFSRPASPEAAAFLRGELLWQSDNENSAN